MFMKEKMLKAAVVLQTSTVYRGLMISGLVVGTMLVFGDQVSAAAGGGGGNNPNDYPALTGGGNGSDILDGLKEGMTKIFGQIAALSHPSAAVGIGIGAVMKKFSMGRQDRVETGNKLIRDSVIGWGTINAVNAIIGTVSSIVG